MQDTVIETAQLLPATKVLLENSAPHNDFQFSILMLTIGSVALSGILIKFLVWPLILKWRESKAIAKEKPASLNCDPCSHIEALKPMLDQILQNQEDSRTEKKEARKEIKELRRDLNKGLDSVHSKIDTHVNWHMQGFQANSPVELPQRRSA